MYMSFCICVWSLCLNDPATSPANPRGVAVSMTLQLALAIVKRMTEECSTGPGAALWTPS